MSQRVLSQHESILMLAALLLAQSAAVQASQVVATVPSTVSMDMGATGLPGSYTFSFSNIADADQLISISGATANISSSEGFTFSLDVEYAGDGSQEIYSGVVANSPHQFDLTTLAGLDFMLGTINGVTFNITSNPVYNEPTELRLFEGANFTFRTSVPEPSTLALLGAAGLSSLLSLRRRRRLGGA